MSLKDDLVIENAAPGDLGELSQLERIGFPADEAASKDAFEYRLKKFPDWFLTARYGGKLIGFINGILSDKKLISDESYLPNSEISGDGRNLLLFGLVVHPDYRKNGIAERLMKTILNNAEKRGIRNIALTCRKWLIPYYEKFGFVNIGVSESVIGNVTWYDMLIER